MIFQKFGSLWTSHFSHNHNITTEGLEYNFSVPETATETCIKADLPYLVLDHHYLETKLPKWSVLLLVYITSVLISQPKFE